MFVNKTDWEIVDKEEYIVKGGDLIVLISTLHGG